MNERILSPQLLELVQAAGPGYSQADPKWIKKFAELIVRACADVGERYADGNYEVPRQILEHFGLEEE